MSRAQQMVVTAKYVYSVSPRKIRSWKDIREGKCALFGKEGEEGTQ